MHEFILQHTRECSPPLCPEIRLRLITPECPLWRAGERELSALKLPDPYWGFCWAGGQALSRYLLDHPEELRGRRVLDFGAGCGIGAIAAALSGAARVLGADTDRTAVVALQINAELNGVQVETTTQDLIGDPLAGWEVILAGDMFYDPAFSARLLAWLRDLAARGALVLIGDPGRGNLDGPALTPIARCLAPADVDPGGTRLRETAVYSLRG
jgi:predicted nicotinamide N-methyase